MPRFSHISCPFKCVPGRWHAGASPIAPVHLGGSWGVGMLQLPPFFLAILLAPEASACRASLIVPIHLGWSWGVRMLERPRSLLSI